MVYTYLQISHIITGEWSDRDLYGLARATMMPPTEAPSEVMTNITQAAQEMCVDGKPVNVSTLGDLLKLLDMPHILDRVIQQLKTLHSMVSVHECMIHVTHVEIAPIESTSLTISLYGVQDEVVSKHRRNYMQLDISEAFDILDNTIFTLHCLI